MASEQAATDAMSDSYRGMSSDNIKGLVLALSSSFFIGASFIVKKKGLKKAGASGVRAGNSLLILTLIVSNDELRSVGVGGHWSVCVSMRNMYDFSTLQIKYVRCLLTNELVARSSIHLRSSVFSSWASLCNVHLALMRNFWS